VKRKPAFAPAFFFFACLSGIFSRGDAELAEVHEAELLSHLKVGDYRVGLFINFNVVRLKDGIVRKVNRL
jgi:hypothetical protein